LQLIILILKKIIIMKHIKNIFLTLLIVLTGFNLFSQQINLERVDPPFWWTGMKNHNLQLMVYGNNISQANPVMNYSGVRLKQVIHVESPNYLFLNIIIGADAEPGIFKIDFKEGKKIVASYSYQLKKRNKDASLHKGFDNSDVIYLLMPDRFRKS